LDRSAVSSRPLAAHALAALLFLALALQAVLAMRLLSATYDETTHLHAGYSYLVRHDFRLNPQHPPLVKLLCAAPLLVLRPDVDWSDPSWTGSPPDEWAFGARMLYGNDADRLLFWGRLPVVLLGLVLALYVRRWAADLFGRPAGLLALFLCAFSPTVIAHAHWVTFDVPLACFGTIALYHLWRFTRDGAVGQLLAGALALGAAAATKYSGLVLLGVAPVLLVAAVSPRIAGPTGTLRPARIVGALVTIVLAVAAVIAAAQLFTGDPLAYWHGLQRVNADHDSSYRYYLMGQFREGGFWYYFLVAFLIKTPLPMLLLLVAAGVAMRRVPAPSRLAEAFLLLPALAWFVATSAFADDLGVRYLLPVYPLLFVFASRVARPLAASRRRAPRLVAAALAAWYAVGTLAIFPDHLAYFNELIGGPAQGHRYLDDSNLDWGQDLKRIKAWLDERGIGTVKMRYGRNTDPAYYGIDARPVSDAEWIDPGPGVYVFGAHLLVRGELYARERGLATDWLERYRPIGRIGYSAYVFRFE